MVLISVIVPTHNPNLGRLTRTLAALAAQKLSPEKWEVLIVDNCSDPEVKNPSWTFPVPLRIVRCTQLGLTYARLAGVTEARGDIVVFVDDDNVLAPDYLKIVQDCFERFPQVGAIGGKSLPEFEIVPNKWVHEFFPLLALRDLGEEEQIFPPVQKPSVLKSYPEIAPIGAGLALRRRALSEWLTLSSKLLPDRIGNELSSGGDNQIVLCVLAAGWGVAYIPKLVLAHLIPASRLAPDYLARLNYSIQKSWMQLLTRNNVNPWSSLRKPSIYLRKLKAWFTYRAWHDKPAFIRWRGACGHFEGRQK